MTLAQVLHINGNMLCFWVFSLFKEGFIPLIVGFYFDSLTLLFLFDLFLEARAEILTKISLFFLGDLKTAKGHFEISSTKRTLEISSYFCGLLKIYELYTSGTCEYHNHIYGHHHPTRESATCKCRKGYVGKHCEKASCR